MTGEERHEAVYLPAHIHLEGYSSLRRWPDYRHHVSVFLLLLHVLVLQRLFFVLLLSLVLVLLFPQLPMVLSLFLLVLALSLSFLFLVLSLFLLDLVLQLFVPVHVLQLVPLVLWQVAFSISHFLAFQRSLRRLRRSR